MILRCDVLALVTIFLAAVSTSAQTQRPMLNAEQSQAEAAHFLQELIRIDTQDPPGNESKVAHYLEGVLKSEGIAPQDTGDGPRQATVLLPASRATDRNVRSLLMGHEDVVPVDRARWTVDPFAGLERDGIIWGRGASDDKAAVAANLEVFLQLKRMKIPLNRDVIFLSEASEEASSAAGMAVQSKSIGTRLPASMHSMKVEARRSSMVKSSTSALLRPKSCRAAQLLSPPEPAATVPFRASIMPSLISRRPSPRPETGRRPAV